MNKIVVAMGAAIALGAAGSASAATFTFLPGQGDVLSTESVMFNFNDDGVDDEAAVTGSGFKFLTGSSGEGAVPAAGDQSRYLSILGGGSATIAFGGSGANGFSLDIGSVDTYNTLTLNFLGGGSQSFTGSQLVTDPDGNQQADYANGRFRFFATGNERIASITFASEGNSFEVDRLAVAAVPEPATWAMMIGGFGLVGGMARRRARASVSFA